MSIRFEITRSNSLLDQYFQLREESFRSELGIENFDGSETEQDRSGQVLVAVDRDNQVLAGARIIGTAPGAAPRLPIESKQFDLLSLFPDLRLADTPYCHWGRLVVHPQYRSKTFNRQFLQRLIELSRSLGYHYAFVISDGNRSRYYQLLHSSLGYNFRSMHEEVAAAETSFAGLEHLVSYAVLRPETEFCYRSEMAALLAKTNPEMSAKQFGGASQDTPNRLAQVA